MNKMLFNLKALKIFHAKKTNCNTLKLGILHLPKILLCCSSFCSTVSFFLSFFYSIFPFLVLPFLSMYFLLLDTIVKSWFHMFSIWQLWPTNRASFQFTINISNVSPSCPNPGRREKIKLNFYFHTSLWCLKRFYEGLKGFHKTFWDTTKKCENRNLT